MLQGTRHGVFSAWLIATLLWLQSPASAASDWLYTFRSGDTLWDICKQYTHHSKCWLELGPHNNIALDRQIPPGTRIRVPAHWLKVPAASATLDYARGEVLIALYDEAPITAKIGQKLPIGSKVITNQGSASIGFADGSSITLEANTELELDTLSNFEQHGMVDSTLRLNRGTIKTRVPKREPRSRFRTITPSAVASVRGTEYRVNLAPSSGSGQDRALTRVEVYDGLVDVGAEAKSFPVPATFGIVAKKGEELAPPVKLLEATKFKGLEHQQYLPFNDQGTLAAPLTIAWHALPDAQAYQLNIFALSNEKEAPEKLLQGQRTDATEVEITGLSEACYQVALRGIDTIGLHGLAAKQALCLKHQLSAPELNAGQSRIEGGQQLTLQWPVIEQATGYELEISEHADFQTLLETLHTSETGATLNYETQVYVRVRALDQDGGHSGFSQTLSWLPESPEQSYWELLIPIGLYVIGLILI